MSESVCEICGGTGWKVIERAGLSGAERCACADAARSERLLRAAGIPPNYERASLDNFTTARDNPVQSQPLVSVLLAIKHYVANFPALDRPGLLLTGGVGTGKTHLAVGALKAVIAKGHEGVFFDYQTLLNRIHAGYDKAAGASDREAYRDALETEIVVLDDLGSHRVNEWVEDTVTSIITHRCNHRKPVIATTNLEVDERVAYRTEGDTAVHKKTLAEVIGPRAQSRLFEMCRIVRMPAVEDYRQRRMR
jgi:DNA replication protein DnaC